MRPGFLSRILLRFRFRLKPPEHFLKSFSSDFPIICGRLLNTP
jgi:hypothetical protein